AKNRKERFATCEDFVRALKGETDADVVTKKTVKTEKAEITPKTERPEKSRNRRKYPRRMKPASRFSPIQKPLSYWGVAWRGALMILLGLLLPVWLTFLVMEYAPNNNRGGLSFIPQYFCFLSCHYLFISGVMNKNIIKDWKMLVGAVS
ncbi:MAG: hypothetical protein Q4C70_10080, partial [Planctomycetia bacterium]|nr:hypothetical protein [Planctomycetia bacterium]